MKVAFFGSYDVRRHPRVRVLQEGFEAYGHQVFECNVPLGFSTEQRVDMLRRPWLSVRLAGRLARSWRGLYRESEKLPDVDLVIVGYMGHFDVHLARRLWPRVPVLLDHMIFARDTALDRGFRSRPLLWILDRIDHAAVAAADIVCVDTDAHRSMLPSGIRSVVVPLGTTSRWFVPATLRRDGPLRVIFHGSFTPLQGAPVIGRAIAFCANSPVQFTMVGRGQDLDQVRLAAAANPNVRWVDWIEPEKLPSTVAAHDVCLGIFGTGPKAGRVVPHKVFEGAAAGCAIITSDTLPQRKLLGGAAIFVEAGNAAAIAENIHALAHAPQRVDVLRAAARAQAEAVFHPRAIVGGLCSQLDLC
jgi:glycosyltransferase involved in cell wall biosynthesis